MWEWQSLLQTSHRSMTCVVSGRMELLPSFLHAGLSTAAAISLSSPVLRCCFRALLHFVRSVARPSQSVDVDSLHISYADIFIWHVFTQLLFNRLGNISTTELSHEYIMSHLGDLRHDTMTSMISQYLDQ